jgi:hypothetical protein
MDTDVQRQERKGPPPWFDRLEVEAIAGRLNSMLQEILRTQLPEGLGAEIAEATEVSQMDSYHDASPKPGSGGELGRINQELSERLRNILMEEYGATWEDVQFGVVRWWALEAGAENPRCDWHCCWDNEKQCWCYWKECCPCV